VLVPLALEDPSAALFVDDGRDVPPKDVVALEETLLAVLALDRTVAVDAAVEEGDSGEVELTLEVAGVVLVLVAVNADVEEASDETPVVEEGVRSALPGVAVTPAPAPEEEPAVFDAVAEDEALVAEDWM